MNFGYLFYLLGLVFVLASLNVQSQQSIILTGRINILLCSFYNF